VEVEFIGRGTHTGELVLGEALALPATGRSTQLPFHDRLEVRDGLIVSAELDFDVEELKGRLLGPAERGCGAAGRGLAAGGFRSRRGGGRRTLELHDRRRERAGAVVIEVDRRVVFVGGSDSAGTILRLGNAVADGKYSHGIS